MKFEVGDIFVHGHKIKLEKGSHIEVKHGDGPEPISCSECRLEPSEHGSFAFLPCAKHFHQITPSDFSMDFIPSGEAND